MQSPVRCVNIDWLEVFAMEIGAPHDAAYFIRAGFVVHEREYGTRIYNEMFTLDGQDGHPLLEVRRNPKNPLMPSCACHLRLVNRTCYFNNACDIMRDFMHNYAYEFQRISRIDICLDLVRFDDNTIPRVFMQRYMRGRFSKINQANIHSHGSDRWTGRVWNSVSWGSPTSMIGTKFYNKTLELYDPKTDSYGKPYIRQAWLQAGMIDNLDRCTLHGEQVEVWRIEFSIKSGVKRWFVIELDGKAKKYQSIHNTLDMYDTKEKQLTMFAALAQHYFHFKRYVMDRRKDLCPDRRLFNFTEQQTVIKPEHNSTLSETAPSSELLMLIRKLRLFLETCHTVEVRNAIVTLLKKLEQMQLRQELQHPYSHEEMLVWQRLMARRQAGEIDETYESVLNEVKALLRLNDKTIIF